jgi:hypothetical protein
VVTRGEQRAQEVRVVKGGNRSLAPYLRGRGAANYGLIILQRGMNYVASGAPS